jgi:hypothetical protein
MDSARSRFAVVSWWHNCEGSLEWLLLGNSGHGGSPRLWQKEEDSLSVLTDSSRRRQDGWDGPATRSWDDGAWSSSMRHYRRGGEKPTHGWAEAGSWCLLYRVKVRRGEAVRCRQMVTDGDGSSTRPFWLGRGNEGAALSDERKWRRPDASSILLLVREGEWQSVAQGAAALAGAVEARMLSEEGDDPRVGWLGQKWAASQADFRWNNEVN